MKARFATLLLAALALASLVAKAKWGVPLGFHEGW